MGNWLSKRFTWVWVGGTGRMRCLAALARWEELSILCRESWVPTEHSRCLEMAPMVSLNLKALLTPPPFPHLGFLLKKFFSLAVKLCKLQSREPTEKRNLLENCAPLNGNFFLLGKCVPLNLESYAVSAYIFNGIDLILHGFTYIVLWIIQAWIHHDACD